MASMNGALFSYDLNGNLISDGVFSYEYDEENQLRSVVGNGITVSYDYDPLGRRHSKAVSSGGTTKYIWDGPEEIEERDSAMQPSVAMRTVREWTNGLPCLTTLCVAGVVSIKQIGKARQSNF